MNILFIANRFPYPPYRGDKLKIFNLAQRLSRKHDLYLITFIQNKNDYQHVEILNKYFKHISLIYLPKYLSIIKCIFGMFSSKPFQVIYFRSKKLKRKLQKLLDDYRIDVIHTQHLRMSQYSYDLNNYKRILDLPDAYSLYWERRSRVKRNFLTKLFDKIEFSRIIKYEKKIINEFDLNLVCSEEDKNFLKKYHNTDNIEILPNGVDLTQFQASGHDYSDNNRIIFTGNMDYAPNVDAVLYFVENIFPLILKKYPQLVFYIVGQKPVKKILKLNCRNVIVTGFVKDLAMEYNKSAVAVSPIRFGAGTLNKVLEPMSMGIPVVSTEVGFKGLGVESGEGVILATNEVQFSEAIIKLLDTEEYRKVVGQKGKVSIENKFSWDKISQMLENYFMKISGEKTSGS
ncbi:MAG: glycosyltransferase [Ignavibacteria bacterium]